MHYLATLCRTLSLEAITRAPAGLHANEVTRAVRQYAGDDEPLITHQLVMVALSRLENDSKIETDMVNRRRIFFLPGRGPNPSRTTVPAAACASPKITPQHPFSALGLDL